MNSCMSKRISCSVSIYILTNKYCKIIVLYLKNKLNVNITRSHVDLKELLDSYRYVDSIRCFSNLLPVCQYGYIFYAC